LDLERRRKYGSKAEAARERRITLRQVEALLKLGRLLPVVLPLDQRGRPKRPG
jgi:hypothetical protein